MNHPLDAANALLDFLYPPRCYLCGAVGAYLCEACEAAWPQPEEPRCPRCGDPLPVGACRRCSSELSPLAGASFACVFDDGGREAVHLLKYNAKRRLAAPMARAMADSLPECSGPFDAIVPIALHSSRLRRRGYNQAAWLAGELAGILNAPEVPWLTRTRATHSQVGLAVGERARNMEGAFGADPAAAGRRILLVDDVCTTGTTAREAARALVRAGAASVWLLTFARDL
ncbi:MAG TPA: ComF family protein [Armatimonadota bacterium]